MPGAKSTFLYRQVLDSDFEKLSALKTDIKFATNSTTEHAVLGQNRLETEKADFCVTARRAMDYNETQSGAKNPKLPILPPRGIEPLFSD